VKLLFAEQVIQNWDHLEEFVSEYQCVLFRAIDQPVSEENLKYMRRQSSRAEITSWSFENEYHYGDFRGDSIEMLRRGYDIHLHYANFGTPKLLIRLPSGSPDLKTSKPYTIKDGLKYIKDKTGPGGCLCIDPYYEPGQLDELWQSHPCSMHLSCCGQNSSMGT